MAAPTRMVTTTAWGHLPFREQSDDALMTRLVGVRMKKLVNRRTDAEEGNEQNQAAKQKSQGRFPGRLQFQDCVHVSEIGLHLINPAMRLQSQAFACFRAEVAAWPCHHGLRPSAGLPGGVAQSSTLLYRRLAAGRTDERAGARRICPPAVRVAASGRLQICDTAEWNSALHLAVRSRACCPNRGARVSDPQQRANLR